MELGFPCPFCPKVLPMIDLPEHIAEAHATTKKYNCDKCDEEFESKTSLEKHTNEKHNIEVFEPKVFEPEVVLIEQSPVKSPESDKENVVPIKANPVLHKCHTCPKSFKTFGSLKLHKKKCERKNPIAKQIKKAVKNAPQKIDKGQEKLSTQNCPICDLHFKSAIQVQKHLTTHYSKKYLTDLFDTQKAQIEEKPKEETKIDDIEVVTEVKQVKCDQCDKSFKYRRTLENHKIKVHEKHPGGFACEDCDKVFDREIYLQSHRSYFHEKIKEDIDIKHLYNPADFEDIVSVKFSCQNCPFSTGNDYEMITHHIETHLEIEEIE